jgi:signal transduction histidine kinase
MPSESRSSQGVFRRARIRLTAWYVGVLAVFLLALGGTVYFVQRSQLEGNVNSGLRATAAKAVHLFSVDKTSEIVAINDGLRYTVVISDSVKPGPKALATPNARELGLPYLPAVRKVLKYDGSDLRTIPSSAGPLRVYTVRAGPTVAIQVARSLEQVNEALDTLLVLLLLAGAGSLIVAAVGGWFLAGKSLEPLHQAFDRQHAFVAHASHELRTPLAVIRANAEYLQTDNPDSVEIADIVSETDRLSALVDALLALARGEAADRPQRDLFDLASVIDGAVESMQSLAGERGVVLSRESESGLLVEGDRDQLRQLVLILLDNALRYTPAGGSVAASVSRAGDWATIRVSDTGIGIDQDVVDRIFDRFYRADEARNRDSGGAGLGLAIAKQLVEEHGGRITVESTPGKGTTFTVRLPMVRRKAAAATPV